MILKFDFQRDEVSFFFLLSHPTALPCIGGAHKPRHVGALHQRAQHGKLAFLLGRDDVLPFLWQNRQVVIAPLLEALVIGSGVGKGNKVADTPAHQIAVSLHVAVPFLIRTDHARNAAGDARFLCNYQLNRS